MSTRDNTSIRESTGLVLTEAFIMRGFYRNNTNAGIVSKRDNLTTPQLSYEDSLALRRAARQLGSYSYDDGENEETLRNSIKAYVETYNNALSSAEGTDDTKLKNAAKQLKQLTSQYSDDLKHIGINIGDDGKLSITDGIFSEVSVKKLGAAFQSENNFMNQISTQAKKLSTCADNYIYTQLTGNGSKINLGL